MAKNSIIRCLFLKLEEFPSEQRGDKCYFSCALSSSNQFERIIIIIIISSRNINKLLICNKCFVCHNNVALTFTTHARRGGGDGGISRLNQIEL